VFGFSVVIIPKGPVFQIYDFDMSEVHTREEDNNITYDIKTKKILYYNNEQFKETTVNLTHTQLKDWTAESLSLLGEKVFPTIFFIHRYQKHI